MQLIWLFRKQWPLVWLFHPQIYLHFVLLRWLPVPNTTLKNTPCEREHASVWPQNDTLCTPANSGCPSGSGRCLSIHWDDSFLLFCLPPLSLQLKVTHQPQVWARPPDGWNDRASFSSAALSVEKSATCVSVFWKCSWVVGRCFGNWAEFLCLVKSPKPALYFNSQKVHLLYKVICWGIMQVNKLMKYWCKADMRTYFWSHRGLNRHLPTTSESTCASQDRRPKITWQACFTITASYIRYPTRVSAVGR